MNNERDSPWVFALMHYQICHQFYDVAQHQGLTLSDGLKWELACFGAAQQARFDQELERVMHEPPKPFCVDGKWYRYVGPAPAPSRR